MDYGDIGLAFIGRIKNYHHRGGAQLPSFPQAISGQGRRCPASGVGRDKEPSFSPRRRRDEPAQGQSVRVAAAVGHGDVDSDCASM